MLVKHYRSQGHGPFAGFPRDRQPTNLKRERILNNSKPHRNSLDNPRQRTDCDTETNEGVSDIWRNCKLTALRFNVWTDAAERLHDICLGDQWDLLPLSVNYLYRALTATMRQLRSSPVLGRNRVGPASTDLLGQRRGTICLGCLPSTDLHCWLAERS